MKMQGKLLFWKCWIGCGISWNLLMRVCIAGTKSLLKSESAGVIPMIGMWLQRP